MTRAGQLTYKRAVSGDLLATAARWKREGYGVALATVVKTWGSAPRQPGSHLIIRDDQLFEGSVSGGCIEGRVVQEALEVIEEGGPRLLEFGISNDEAWEVGLSCGGRIEVLVEAIQ